MRFRCRCHKVPFHQLIAIVCLVRSSRNSPTSGEDKGCNTYFGEGECEDFSLGGLFAGAICCYSSRQSVEVGDIYSHDTFNINIIKSITGIGSIACVHDHDSKVIEEEVEK